MVRGNALQGFSLDFGLSAGCRYFGTLVNFPLALLLELLNLHY